MAKTLQGMIRSCMKVYCEKIIEYSDSCEEHCVFCNENGDCCIREADNFIKEVWEKKQEV